MDRLYTTCAQIYLDESQFASQPAEDCPRGGGRLPICGCPEPARSSVRAAIATYCSAVEGQNFEDLMLSICPPEIPSSTEEIIVTQAVGSPLSVASSASEASTTANPTTASSERITSIVTVVQSLSETQLPNAKTETTSTEIVSTLGNPVAVTSEPSSSSSQTEESSSTASLINSLDTSTTGSSSQSLLTTMITVTTSASNTSSVVQSTPPPVPVPTSSTGTDLSAGAKVGIGVGTAFGFTTLVLLALLFWKRRQNRNSMEEGALGSDSGKAELAGAHGSNGRGSLLAETPELANNGSPGGDGGGIVGASEMEHRDVQPRHELWTKDGLAYIPELDHSHNQTPAVGGAASYSPQATSPISRRDIVSWEGPASPSSGFGPSMSGPLPAAFDLYPSARTSAAMQEETELEYQARRLQERRASIAVRERIAFEKEQLAMEEEAFRRRKAMQQRGVGS